MLHISAVMYGMNLSTAFSSSLVLTCQPLFTLAILAGLGAERLRRQQVAGTLIAFSGIVLFLADKFAAGLSRAGLGDLTLLVAGAAFSAYTVLQRPLADRYGPLIVLSYTLLFSMPIMLCSRTATWLRSTSRVRPRNLGGALLGARGLLVLRLAALDLGEQRARRRAQRALHVPDAAGRGRHGLAHARRDLHLAQARGRRDHDGGRCLGAVRRRAASQGSGQPDSA